MSKWFRFYDEVLDDPKVQRLDAETFKAWVNLLCLASRNSGVFPSIEDIAFALRLNENGAITVLERLRNAGLIDRRNGGANGAHYAPHGWDRRQFKSDTSNDRVKRYRDKKCNVTETPPETETDTDKNLSSLRSDRERDTALVPVEHEVEKPKTRKKSNDLDCSPRLVELGCPETLVRQWVAIRKSKSAPILTETALEALIREASKAGMTVHQAVTRAVEEGWRGFKADWLVGNQQQARAGPNQNQRISQHDQIAEFERTMRGYPDDQFSGTTIDGTAHPERRDADLEAVQMLPGLPQ